jgi:hypothetical protein
LHLSNIIFPLPERRHSMVPYAHPNLGDHERVELSRRQHAPAAPTGSKKRRSLRL